MKHNEVAGLSTVEGQAGERVGVHGLRIPTSIEYLQEFDTGEYRALMPAMPEVPDTTRSPGREARRHVADAVVPNVAFLVAYETVSVTAGVIAAVAAGLVLVVVRLLNKQKLTMVFAAFGVVLLHAGTVVATGDGRDYFLPWLLFNTGLTLALAGSLALGRPISARLARSAALSRDAPKHRKVTALWTALCALHLAVGLPLYSADLVVALGVAKFVLGPPAILLLGIWSWRILRGPAAGEARAESGKDEPTS
ncbi:hypothetical protein GCM10027445_25690 [Amycolatopsis endophytica]|uniref:Intracellular septation protein A n=1 Tax=Amycolatopsis endophytica TaxID=860233 RepID=A0A853BAY6_9PSEU|nr:DUF3159 domain-containing protein [Amycolatopsis endophytica]NYI92339.1 intracellular septation protein A [Amycolatopsis endophytica]